MKRSNYKALSLFTMGAIACALFTVSCKSKDYKDSDATTDSLQAKMMADSTAKADSAKVAAMTADTSMSTSMAGSLKPNPAKKRGKGKVIFLVDKDYEQRYSTMPIEMNTEGIYSRAEIKPTFPGGEAALAKYIQDNINYPQAAIDEGVEGTVEVMFAVDENGKVYTPVIKGKKAGYGLDQEATRVVSRMPTWNPGQIKGKNVKSYYTLPITFQIN
jgi:TonB family protein